MLISGEGARMVSADGGQERGSFDDPLAFLEVNQALKDQLQAIYKTLAGILSRHPN